MRLSRATLFLLAAPGALVLLVFFGLPLLALVPEAASASGDGFARVLRDPLFWTGLRNSALLAVTAGGLSLVIGFFVALDLSRRGPALRTALMFCISLPLTFSGLIVAYGFILAFGRSGFVTLSLAELGVDPACFASFIYSPAGLAFAYAYYLTPRVVLMLLPALVNFDRAQLDAAHALGATPRRALLDILLPQLVPAGLAAFCLVTAVALGTYGTALALVGTQVNILPLLLYSKISDAGGDFPAAAALSLILLAVCTLVMAVGELFILHRARRDDRPAAGH